MTTIFSCICGNYDESQDLENDFKDKREPLNEHVIFFYSLFNMKFHANFSWKVLIFCKKKQPVKYIPKFGHDDFRSKLNADDLYELRKNREFKVKMSQIMKEISIYTFFLFILYVVAFSNLSSSSFQYNQLFFNTFVHKQNGASMGLNEVNKNWFVLIYYFQAKNILVRRRHMKNYFND